MSDTNRLPRLGGSKPVPFVRPALVAGLLLASACADFSQQPSRGERLTVVNDPVVLEARMRRMNQPLRFVTPTGTSAAAFRSDPTLPTVTLTLRAEVLPPIVDGMLVQATHIGAFDSFAVVVYNVQGDARMGAVDLFNLKDPTNPKLVSQALWRGTDVAAVTLAQDRAYFATATDDPAFPEPAVLEELTVVDDKFTTVSRRVGVPSFAATGVDVRNDLVFVSSGTGGPNLGGLSILDRLSLQRRSFDPFDDARAVQANDEFIAVSQGTPARLRLYDRATGSLLVTLPLPGASLAESKSTVEVRGPWAFVAAGDGGVHLVQMRRREIVRTLPPPVVPGLDPTLAVSNSVSVFDDFVFVANGGAGMTVAYSDYKTTPDDGTPIFVSLGRIELNGSVNYLFCGPMVFVATGAGGLQIVELSGHQ